MQLRTQPPERPLTLVHHVDERGVWATAGREVWFRAAGGGAWERIATFPTRLPTDLSAPLRLARRLARAEKCNLHPTRSGHLLGIRGGCAYRIEDGHMTPLFTLQGDCVMSRSIAETPEGELYFGDYFMNPERRPVRVYRVAPDLRSHEVAVELESPRVRHVHAVHADPFVAGRLWLTTGDFEGECFLGTSDDGLRTVRYLGDGGQLWRAVGLFFHEDRIGWLTDTHIAQNYVVGLDRASEAISIHGERDASSWYAAQTTDGLCLATTTVEPGPGIHTDRARLLVSRDGVGFEVLAEFPKDPWPMRFFGFGSLSLPAGRFSSRSFYLSGEGVRGLEGETLHCSIERAGDPAS